MYKRQAKYNDPIIIVAGDWNKADVDIAFDDFATIEAVPTPPRRGDETLDTVFCNVG